MAVPPNSIACHLVKDFGPKLHPQTHSHTTPFCRVPSSWVAKMVARQSRRTNPKKPTNLRSWRVVIMRSKGEYLGSVEAPGRESAEAVAIKQFDLDQDQRGRLLIRERL
jgi:hypothetical protein